MTGWRVERKPNGIRVYVAEIEFWLDEKECAKLAKEIWYAQREYWKKA